MKELSYSESKGYGRVNWREILNQEEFTPESLEKISVLANSWFTCACGSQSVLLPRCAVFSCPIDRGLVRLGDDFSENVSDMQKSFGSDYFDLYRLKALGMLDDIESRTAKILSELP